MLLDFLADRRQRVGEGDDMLVLGAFSDLAETRMVAVLLGPFASRPVA